jgi:hypothetical protein
MVTVGSLRRTRTGGGDVMKLFTGLLLGSALIVLMLVPTAIAGEKPWFDMENCAFCSNLIEDPKLLDNMVWEHHEISNGIVTVTTIKPEFLESYRKASAAMDAVGKRIAAGEQVPMCGMCQSMGSFFMKGAKMDYVETSVGDVMLLTSSDSTVVAEIKAWAKRTNDEMAKMEAEHKHEHGEK